MGNFVQGNAQHETEHARLSIVGQTVESGTTFPTANLYDRQRFYRTDRDVQYFRDLANARWLSDQRTITFPSRSAQPYSGSTFWDAMLAGYDIGNAGVLIEKLYGSMYTNVAQDATNYYTIQVFIGTLPGPGWVQTGLTGTFDTKTFTTVGDFYEIGPLSLNQVASAANKFVFARALQVGAARQFQAWFSLTYRLIG